VRAFVVAAALALTACGSSARSPEEIVRAWSAAINEDHNAEAGALFADGAKVIQNGELVLRTRDEAVAWNASLPCAGHIESLARDGDDVSATFVLGERPHHRCDGPGLRAAAVFRVKGGKIVLWHQTPPPEQAQSA
jgi:limonene-1,2-epoxide hydrolase